MLTQPNVTQKPLRSRHLHYESARYLHFENTVPVYIAWYGKTYAVKGTDEENKYNKRHFHSMKLHCILVPLKHIPSYQGYSVDHFLPITSQSHRQNIPTSQIFFFII